MLVDAHRNFGVSLVAVAPSPSTSGLTLTVTTGDGAAIFNTGSFVPPYNVTICTPGTLPTPSGVSMGEVVRVTGMSGDVLTIVRQQELSGARPIAVGDQILVGATSKTFTDIEVADALNLKIANNLSDLASITTAKANLGLAAVFGVYGAYSSFGHSYSVLGDADPTAPNANSAAAFESFSHILASSLGIPPDETDLFGKGGAMISGWSPGGISTTADNQGVGVMMKHYYPGHWYHGTGITASLSSKASPSLLSFFYGINEIIRMGLATSTDLQRCTANGLRAMLARGRAQVVIPSTDTVNVFTNGAANIVYSTGGFDDTTVAPRPVATSGIAALDYCTGATARISTQNGDYVEHNILNDWKGGVIYATFMGTAGNWSTLGTTMTTGTTAITVSDANSAHTLYANGDVIQIGTEKMTVTAGGGTTALVVTRASAGTTATTHAVNDPVFLPSDTAKVTISGTANGVFVGATPGAYTAGTLGSIATGTKISDGTGTVSLAASGLSLPIYFFNTAYRTGNFVTARFYVPASEAGKTVRFTVGGIVGNEYVMFDHVGYEDPTASTELVFNMPQFAYNGFANANVTNTASINTALSGVVTEFGSPTVLVDLATEFEALYGGTWQADTGTGGTVHFTPTNATRCEVGIGSVLRSFTVPATTFAPAGAAEEILVTAITKTSTTDWSLTVTRSWKGPGGAISTSSVSAAAYNHLAGSGAWDARAFSQADRLHPSPLGHQRIAAIGLDRLASVTQTSLAVAASGSYVGRRRPRVRPGGFYPLIRNSGGTRGVQAPTKQVIFAYPFEIKSRCSLLEVGVEITSGQAGGLIHWGLWADGLGYPGGRLRDLGVSNALTSSDSILTLAQPIPLRPGWIHLGFFVDATATAPTLRTLPASGIVPDYPVAATAVAATIFGSNTNGSPFGWASASQTTIPDPFPAGATPLIGANSSGNICPVVYLKFDAPVVD